MKTNKEILLKFISTQGYKRNSPDVNNPVNVIPSENITMQDVDFPVYGVDNLGNEQLMMPGGEYQFPGDYVIETPALQKGGEMIKRADGSYSKRGLWDNIRANKGSGKKPTKEMLEQERKIKMKQEGGEMEEQMYQPLQGQPDISAALGEISRMIEQGDDPVEIYNTMVESGVPEEQAQEIIQEAVSALEESDIEEEDIPMDFDEMSEYEGFGEYEEEEEEIDPAEMKTGGSIKIKNSKKGTFKVQATKMGMSVPEAAEYILRHKEDFTPEMVKKANFAKNFAKELGGEIYDLKQYAEGGGVPERYKNMGFTKVGAKRKSTRPGKKWMVLAKKGDQYKVVHGGWKGMKDYTQHHSKERREKFWSRMGGRDSAKAKDPFSPLYWHKRFGTWQEGGETPDMFDYENFKDGDFRTDITTSNTLGNLKNSNFNKTMGALNTLGDPRSMIWALPNTGLLGKLKGVAGLAAGVSGAVLGYEKMFPGKNKNKESYISNFETGEFGKMDDVIASRQPKAPTAPPQPLSPRPVSGGSGMGSLYLNQQKDNEMFSELGLQGYEWAGVVTTPYMQMGGSTPDFRQWFVQNATRPEVMQNSANQQMLMDMWKRETGQSTAPSNGSGTPTIPATTVPSAGTSGTAPAGTTLFVSNTPETEREFSSWTSTKYGDPAGQIAANNALAGFGMLNTVRSARNNEKEYEEMMRKVGNTDQRYNVYNPANPFGNYTLNAGPASNFALVANPYAQDFGTRMSGAKYGGTFSEGGEYYVSDEELKMILAMGGEIEFLE